LRKRILASRRGHSAGDAPSGITTAPGSRRRKSARSARRQPLEPPSRKELAPDALAQQALRFLLQTGEAIELSEDVVSSADGFARAREIVKKFLSQHESATAGELRQALGTSRRIVIPLLERLDKEV